MQTTQQIKDELQEHQRAAKALLDEKGARAWSAAEQASFDGHMDAAEGLSRALAEREAVANRAAAGGAPAAGRKSQLTDLRAGLDIWLRRSAAEWTPREAAKVANTMSTTTPSEGGYTVAPMVARTWIDSLKDYGSMRRASSYLLTDTGADMSFPYLDGRYEEGEIVLQNVPANMSDVVFAGTPVNVFKFGSKVFTVPIELLQDASIDVAGLVFKRARDRIGRAQNRYFTTGNGTGQPYGITAAPPSLVGASGDTGLSAITWDQLMTLVDSLDASYLQEPDIKPTVAGAGPGWMFNQTVRKHLRKVKDLNGRPVWTPSYDAGITVAGDRLLGYPVHLNNDMPSPAANAVSVAFGNFKNYLVRDALEMTLFRMDDSAFITKGEVGFLAWARAGGNLLDQASVVTYKHSAS